MSISTLRLVLCRAGEVRLALDARQVRAVRPFEPSLGRYPWFDELLAGPRPARTAATPFLVAFEAKARVPGVVVSTLEDMTTVTLREVRPLPALVARFAGKYGLWGIVLIDDIPWLLFDPEGIAAPIVAGTPEDGEPQCE